MKLSVIAGSLTIGMLCSACSNSDNNILPVSAEQALLNENRVLWDSQQMTDYQYTYRVVCFCPPQENVVIVVEADEVAEAFYTPSGTYLTDEELSHLYTIDGLFGEVQTAIDDDADTLTVAYHPTLGYPESIYIDPEEAVADEEITHVVVDFQ